MGMKLIALFWGFAEATSFFIVPDVWLTFVGRDLLAKGLKACWPALAGALLGGALMYGWGRANPDAARRALERVPAINAAMVEAAAADMEANGVMAIFRAPLKGVPYKIFAVEAARHDVPLALFLLITIPARLLRFSATTVGVHFALKLALGNTSARTRLIALGSGWIIFYMVYFIRVGG